MRKLIQEVNDTKLGIESKDGNDPGVILKKLKYNSKYAGSIHDIGNDKFFIIYCLPEKIFIYKVYCKLFKDFVTVCVDGTGSIVLPLQVTENHKSPHIFLYEIVINFLHTTVSVDQFLSASQTTNKILFYLNEWLISAEIKPPHRTITNPRQQLGLYLYDESNDTSNEILPSFDEKEHHFVNAHSSKIFTSSNVDNASDRNEETSLTRDQAFINPIPDAQRKRTWIIEEDFSGLPSSQNNNGFKNDFKKRRKCKKTAN